MTIELNSDSYVVGVWFSANPETGNDWLACVIKDPENPEKYKGWSRFRCAIDGKIFDNNDIKRWTTFVSKNGYNEDEMIGVVDSLQENVIAMGFRQTDKIIIKGDMHKFFELTKGKEWMNIRQESLSNE